MNSLACLLLLFSCALAASGGAAGRLLGTTPISRENAGKPVPRYANGHTVFFGRDQQTVDVYDRTGAPRSHVRIALPDTERIMIADASVSASGSIAVTGAAVATGGGQAASTIVWFGADGRLLRMVRTSPFAAQRLHFSEDGHLWAVGLVRDASGTREEAEHDLLREYDGDGVLVAEAGSEVAVWRH